MYKSRPTCAGEGVDQLVLQGADGHVGSLGHVEDVVCQAALGAPGLADHAPREGPQSAQDAEQAALAAAVGAGDEEVGARRHAQAEVLHQRRPGRRDHQGPVEGDLVGGGLHAAPRAGQLGCQLACPHAQLLT